MAIERARSSDIGRESAPSDRDALTSGLGWLGLAFGVVSLVALATNRRRTSVAAAAASGAAAFEALRRRHSVGRGPSATRFTPAITINRPVQEVYAFWRDFENHPRFMRNLKTVEVLDEHRSRWRAEGPGGATIEWTAEIVEDRPNERIEWRSAGDTELGNEGAVTFTPAPGDRGTEVRLEMKASPPGGKVATTIAKLFRQSPEQKVQDGLRAFKQLVETGQLVRSDASVLGGRHPARPLEHHAPPSAP